jgi:CheY-like chemotaxis protein
MLPRVFDLFVQGDRSLERAPGGLGIGLTVVDRLVALHDGRVGAFSAGPGQGSEFTIRLPRLSPPGGADAAASIDGARPQALAPKRRVLVVDDNVDACESIAMILDLAGHATRCVHDGPSVLDAALKYRPDAVLLDIGLPGMSGYDVARQLRARPEFHRTTLIAMTGYGQAADRAAAAAAGFDHHLTKPVDPQVLQDRLAESFAGP